MGITFWQWEFLTAQQKRRVLLAVGIAGFLMGGLLLLIAPGLAPIVGACLFISGVALFEGVVRFGITDLPQNRDAVLEEIVRRIEQGRRWVLVACSSSGVDVLLSWRDGRIADLLKAKAKRGVVVEILRGGEASSPSQTAWPPDYQVYSCRSDPPFHGVLVDGRVLVEEAQHHGGLPAEMIWQNVRCIARPDTAGDRFEISFNQHKFTAQAA